MQKLGSALLFLILFVVFGPIRAEEPQGRLIEETWEAAQLEGARVGYFHTTVHEFEVGGETILRTVQRMDLTVRRFNATARLSASVGTSETRTGTVVGVGLRIAQPGGDLVISGTVEGKQLRYRADNGRIDKLIPWDDKVLGLYRQERLFKDRKLGAGESFTYLSYEPTLNAVVPVRGKVGDEEEVITPTGKRRLLRVDARPDRVDTGTAKISLPPILLWLDKDLTIVRRQVELPGLGNVLTHRTTRDIAVAGGGAVVRGPDIGEQTLIPINRVIGRLNGPNRVVYRVTVKEDDDPASVLATDARQTITGLKGNTFEVHVRAIRAPERVEAPDQPAAAEFLANCYYLKKEDPTIRDFARVAIGDADTDLLRARRIERWVHDRVRNDNSVGFCPADQVARGLAGDCRQRAMLMAAMCRAAGVPSRTALGLVPATDNQRRPIMAYHMWCEVWFRGQWLAFDPTHGEGGIGGAHLKIANQSWHDVQDLKPMLAVQRVLGKLAIEVVSIDGR